METKNTELQEALDAIKTLGGQFLICARCGKEIKNEQDEWISVQSYIETHSEVEFTHGICPDCSERAYAELR